MDFSNWATGFSGCDGGDIGTPSAPSTWVCGIEWGGGATAEDWRVMMSQDVSAPPAGYDSTEENLAFIYNRQTLKLITAILGGKVADYRSTAETTRPFVRAGVGYFKMNLYPFAFKNTSPAMWASGFDEMTEFPTKPDYVRWCKARRLPVLREWALRHRPKLIICFGKTSWTISNWRSAKEAARSFARPSLAKSCDGFARTMELWWPSAPSLLTGMA